MKNETFSKIPLLIVKVVNSKKTFDKILEALNGIWSSEQGKEVKFELKEINLNMIPKSFFEENKRIIFLGGDHSMSFSLVKTFNACFKNAALIVLDAHPDCLPGYELSHGWLRALIEKGFDPRNIFLVGNRNSDLRESSFLKEKKVNIFSINELTESLEESCQYLMERVKDFEALYLSIDIDVVDPVFAPGTNWPEPGGLSSRQIIYLIQKLSLLKNLKAADIVEINPEKDLNNLTIKLAAKLIAELS